MSPASSTPAKAKQLFDAAGGYEGTLTADRQRRRRTQAWAEAACNSIKNTLGMECVASITPDFSHPANQIDARELKGIFRSGWQMDYPSIENFLAPIYGTGAGSNYTEYNNKKFDAKLAEAAAADTTRRRTRCTRRPRRSWPRTSRRCRCGPGYARSGWSDRVTDVKLTRSARST